MTGAELSTAIDLLEYGVAGAAISLAALSKMEGELENSDSYIDHYQDEIESLAKGENKVPADQKLEYAEEMIENDNDPTEEILGVRDALEDYLEIQDEKAEEYRNLV